MPDSFLWWRDGIIYQIYPRSFSDSNQDGLGDLNGITNHLDHLAGLGVDGIWLSPIYPSPDADFGYDISNYTSIDPRIGSLEDFDRLVEEAHRRNIRIILDLVVNHTSEDHPWFIESRSSRENPKRDWYLWKDASPGRGRPNNWQSIFGGSGWEFDSLTQQYYFHMFARQQPDLNWNNPDVRRAILEVVRFWLDRGTDGFRLDVFNAYFKNPLFPDNPHRLGLRGFERQRHIHDINQPELIPFLADFRALLDSYPERYSVGETFLSNPEIAASYSGPDRLHATFNFSFTESPWSPRGILNAISCWENALGEGVWPNYVLSNHDLPRAVTRFSSKPNNQRAKVAAALLLTLRGTPFLYYGEEIGMRDIRLKRSEILDPPGKRYWPFYKGRDACRSPMQWDGTPNSGFSPSHPWLPASPDYSKRNVEIQNKDPDSILNFYKDLIRYRRASCALQSGSFEPIGGQAWQILAYLRTAGEEKVLVALNFSSRVQRIDLSTIEFHTAELILSNCRRTLPGFTQRGFNLEPDEACLLRIL